MKNNTVFMEIITPEEMFYSGNIEMLIVKTFDGEEGFMAKHTWCCKLLAEEGKLKFRPEGEKNFKNVYIHGGYVDIKDSFVVYTDKAEWI